MRQADDADVRASAADTTQRIEGELSREIARWEEALQMDHRNWSVHEELAGLYDEYGDPQEAAEHYEASWRVQAPSGGEMLLPLAQARERAADAEHARGAWLLASYSSETRIAETAWEHLPRRYPYASEFRRALELDFRKYRG